MEKMREKELALDLLADVAGGFVQAVALHCFINNIDIAPGGDRKSTRLNSSHSL